MSDHVCEYCGEPSYPSWPCGCKHKDSPVLNESGKKNRAWDKWWDENKHQYCQRCKLLIREAFMSGYDFKLYDDT